DGGTTFTPITAGISSSDPSEFYVPYVIDPSRANRLLLGTNRIYETTTNGDNWVPISTPNTNGWITSIPIRAIGLAPSDSDTIYAAAGVYVFVTTYHGATWMRRDLPLGGTGTNLVPTDL